ncbi:putative cytochrome P450 [Macrophomina phaseolina]|uniref:Cytochrome P450 n=1 Tax=Macrophomina phaseolina TaxID=35725 RepID=A0ABQ8G8B3_9PEZI|nr:putative cytochrome P450 [Macrophomina phaseolina]
MDSKALNVDQVFSRLSRYSTGGPSSTSAAVAVAVAVAVILISALAHLGRKRQYPRVGKSRLYTWLPFVTPMRYELDKYALGGYAKINKGQGKPFLMKFFNFDTLMMPPKYLQDLKKASLDSLSFNVSFSDAFNLDATVGDLYWSDNMRLAVVNYLNKQLKRFTPELVEEVIYAFDKEIGRPSTWKNVVAAKISGDVIHRVTNRVLVGPTLCRDETFLQTSQRFTSTLLPAAVWTNFMTFGPLRRTFSKLTTFFHKSQLEASIKLLTPVIEQRMNQRRAGKPADLSDSIEWFIEIAENMNDPRELTVRRLAENVLHLLFAANSAPGALVTQMVYEVLMNPQYLKLLREEIDSSIQAHGSWTADALANMIVLDGFVRETLRMYPPGSIACSRTVTTDSYTLHDGTKLPKGSQFAFPVLAIQMDAANYKDASTFDPYRFVDRDVNGKSRSNTLLSTTVTAEYLPFGYGKHACPGRFFGILEAKLVFAKLVQDYDFEWAEPVSARPPNISIEGMVPPNQTQVIKIKAKSA